MTRFRRSAMTCGLAALALAGAAWAQATPGRATGATPGELTAAPLPPPLPAQGGEVFRSVDENGTPSFSQVPPPGRASRPVELRPLSGSIEAPRTTPRPPAASPAREADGAAAAGDTAARMPQPPRAAPREGPRGMSFDTFIRLRRGMSEGEVLGRAGPPDYRGEEINLGLRQESWYYLPTTGEPFTTIIQLRGGRVIGTERIRQL